MDPRRWRSTQLSRTLSNLKSKKKISFYILILNQSIIGCIKDAPICSKIFFLKLNWFRPLIRRFRTLKRCCSAKRVFVLTVAPSTHRDHEGKITEKLDEECAVEYDSSDVSIVLEVGVNGGHHQAANGDQWLVWKNGRTEESSSVRSDSLQVRPIEDRMYVTWTFASF